MLVYAAWRRYHFAPDAPMSAYSGPPRSKPPFVAMTRSSGYGCSASRISSSLLSGP